MSLNGARTTVRRATCAAAMLVAFSAAGSMPSARADDGGIQQAPPPVSPPPATVPMPQTLPGGASQLQETHGDWRVTCVQQNNQTVCAFATQLIDKDSRQLVIGIELRASAIDKAEGNMVMPFGLAVDKPVTLQIDDTGSSTPLRFKTCLPAGCVVTLAFDQATVAALKKGTVLNVKATAAENGQDASFKLSLRGFGSALERTAALSK